MPDSPKTIKCKSCGAPLNYRHGENVLHCNYCGSTTMLADYDNIVTIAEPFIIPNKLTKGTASASCRKWMAQGTFKAKDLPDKATFRKLEARYLPFWTVRAHVKTSFSGAKGASDVQGSVEEEVAWVVYARTDPGDIFGFWALNPGAQSTAPDWGDFPLKLNIGSDKSEGIDLVTGKEPFDQKLVGDVELINGQITESDAKKKAETEIAAFSRKKAVDKNAGVTFSSFDVTTSFEKVDLVYLPLWSIEYAYRGKPYRMLLEGHRGRVLAGEAPVGKWDKVVVLSIIFGSIGIISAILAGAFNWPYLYILSAISFLIIGVYAIKAALT